MLVLTRKSNQKIIVGKNIVITVVRVQGDQVSIGIDAPRTTLIYREEVFNEIKQANAGGAVKSETVDVKSMAKNLKGTFKGSMKQASKFSKLRELDKQGG